MPEIEIDKVKEETTIKPKWKVTNFLCPFCNQPMMSQQDSRGVWVWCAQPPEKCKISEVAGHGKNENGAYEIILEKFKK